MAAGAADTRVIRVFISSTFRDMQAEREELIKRVFPEIRRMCEQRGVTWGEVDLRWGVTDEQKAEGAVLPICLREIELTRPYFIGLLGERYGWVPDEIPTTVAELQPWIHPDEGRSVTELEILHGVLNDPEMAGHAYFYLRDPAYVDGLPESERVDHLDPEPELHAKLARLKDRIRTSGFPVREAYPDPVALGTLVRDDLIELVDRLYPESEVPDPLDREAAAHAAYASSRFTTYVGRDESFARLDAHAAGDGPPLVVTGESGSGKSALVANWVQRYRESPAGRDALVIEHYVGASPESADWEAMLRRIMGELARRFGITDEIPEQPDALRAALGSFLRQAGGAGRVVLVIDGLNQLDDRDAAPDLVWLPLDIPPGIRLVLTTLAGRPLDALEHRTVERFDVAPLDDRERRVLIEQFLARFSKALSADHANRLATADASGNPLFLRTVLDELRQHGDHFTLGDLIDSYLASTSVADLFDRVLARYERDYERDRPGLVRDGFASLWAARRGLAEVEVLDVLGAPGGGGFADRPGRSRSGAKATNGGGDPLPRAVWSPLFLAAENSLVTRSGLVNLGHDYLRQAVEQRYLADDAAKQAEHSQLADTFGAYELGPRQRDELPWQLQHAARWDDLNTRLADLVFFQAVYDANVRDVQRYWTRLEAESSHRMVDAYRALIDDPGGRDPQLLWSVAVVLMFAGYYDEAITLQRVLVHTFREAGLNQQLDEALTNLAAMLRERDVPDEVLALLTEAEQLARDRGDMASVASALGGQGIAKQMKHDLDGALALMQEEERIYRELGILDGVQRSIGNQARVLSQRPDYDGAMARYVEQEQLCRQIGDPVALQACLAGQADILGVRGDLEGALARLAGQEQLLRELGNAAELHWCLGKQVPSLTSLGRFDEAIAASTEQEEICRRIGHRSGLASCLVNRAQTLEQRGDAEAALPLLDEVTQLGEELDDLDIVAQALGVRARVLRARGQLDEALTLMQQEERIFRELDKLQGVEGSLGNQAQVLQALGRLDEALTAARDAERIDRELGMPTQLQAALGTQASIQADLGAHAEAMRLFQEQEQMCREFGLSNALQASIGGQGVVLHKTGDTAGALAKYGEQEQLCRDLGLSAALQQNLLNQATLLRESGDLPRALARYQEHEQLCRQHDDQAWLARSILAQAEILTAAGDAQNALNRYQEIMQLCRANGDDEGLRGALTMCASLLTNAGQPDAAFPLFDEAEQLCRAAHDKAMLQRCLGNRSTAHINRGEMDVAARLLDEQVAIARELGDKEGIQAGVGNQAIVAKARGDLAGALTMLEEQERLCRELNNAQGLAIAVANKGEVLGASGRTAEAIAALSEAEGMARQIGLAPMADQIQVMVSQLRAAGG